MVSKVLVPLDGSSVAEQAIPFAQALLPVAGEILLLRVVPEIDPLLSELLWKLQSVSETAEIVAVKAELEQVKVRASDTRTRWTSNVVRGAPAEEILMAIARSNAGVVAMTTHGRGALGRATFGSVADRISRESPIPVLLVRPRPAGQTLATPYFRRLLVPLDGSDLAEASIPLVVGLAKQLGIPTHLVRVVSVAAVLAPLADGFMPAISPSADLYQQMVEAIDSDAKDYLKSVAERLGQERAPATWAVLEGSPYFAISEATKPGDLIVMTSHGRSGVMRWLMGSVAEKLVREATVPVLLIPSAGRGKGAVPD